MYPTIVIVMVETQRSMTDICEITSPSNAIRLAGPVGSDPEARPATLGHLSFAINSTMDNESESRPSHALQSQDVEERGLENDILEV